MTISSSGKSEAVQACHSVYFDIFVVCGYVAVFQLATMNREQLFFSVSVQRWALAMWSLSIATQVSATLLIAWKIWSMHSGTVGPHRRLKSISIGWIVVESGAVLSFTHVLVLAFYQLKVAAAGIPSNMIGQLDVSSI